MRRLALRPLDASNTSYAEELHAVSRGEDGVMAVLCDSGSSERLLMEYKLLDLQCSHICGAAKNLTACSEKDRSDLRAVVACRGTLHMALNRVTSSSMVLLPRRFSERLLVLAALIRVRCDATLLTATPGPWVHSLMQIWLHTMFVLCMSPPHAPRRRVRRAK